MPNIELLLCPGLLKDALSSVLTGAGFSVLQEPGQDDPHTIVIIDPEDCKEPNIVGVHVPRRVKIVVLANEADGLGLGLGKTAQRSGPLSHDLSADAYLRSLGLINSGERVLPPDAGCEKKTLAPSGSAKPRSDDRGLWSQEEQMLFHILEGHSNKTIAQRLGMTTATVKVHLDSLLCKIRVDNRTQAAVWALVNLPEFSDIPRDFI